MVLSWGWTRCLNWQSITFIKLVWSLPLQTFFQFQNFYSCYWSIRPAIFSRTPGNSETFRQSSALSCLWMSLQWWKYISPQSIKCIYPLTLPLKEIVFLEQKTCHKRTFPFPWSSGLSSPASLGRYQSCQSQKVKYYPTTSFFLPWIHFFRDKNKGIQIPSEMEGSGRCKNLRGTALKDFEQL